MLSKEVSDIISHDDAGHPGSCLSLFVWCVVYVCLVCDVCVFCVLCGMFGGFLVSFCSFSSVF